ncbi:MAG: murein biosynthesis integral membrane protein MurJ [Planctomycetes bacterium]|nr:murein biosynthesis integral membrane protein MurJ [Planctomycetota bacterium]
MTQRFERHARTVSLLTIVSRVTGLARDASLSRVFGAGTLMDAFFFAFLIPNLFRRLFGEGALAAAFLPAFSRLEREDPEMARRLASLIVSGLAVVLGVIVLVSEAVLFALSARTDHGSLALWLTMIMLPYMPLVCVVAILGAMLQVRGRFGPTAAAPIVLNLCLIGAVVGLAFVFPAGDTGDGSGRLAHIGAVAASVVLAGALQVLWSLLALRARPWWTREMRPARDTARRVLGQALPMILGLGVLQLNTLFDGLIASYPTTIGSTIFGVDYPLDAGAMSAVSYAQRLYQFPLGVFGIAVATAIFPALAALADDPDAFGRTVRRGLRLVVFIGLPASVGLVLVREPLTSVILEGGAFTQDNTERVGRVLLGYAPAIWAYSTVHVLTRAFYARGDAMTPVRVAVSVVVLNVVLNCTLIWTPLREAGLAWSTAICSTVQGLALLALLRRRIGPIVDGAVTASAVKSVLAALLMGVAVWLVATLVPTWGDGWIATLGRLAMLVITGAVVFGGVARALRMPELRWTIRPKPGKSSSVP